MKKVKINREEQIKWYLSDFARFAERLNGGSQSTLHGTRKQAIKQFSKLGFPTTRDEDWKYTSVDSLLAERFNLSTAASNVSDSFIKPLMFEKSAENTLVFINGHYSEALSNLQLNIPGLVVSSLAAAAEKHSELVSRYLGRYADCEAQAFVALNTGFVLDGLFIYVPDNISVEQSVHVIHLADPDAGPFISHPRSLVVIGKNSELKLTESYHSKGDGSYFNNAVSEFVVDENARLDHVKIQEESEAAFHVSYTQFQQERHSVISTVNVDLGGSLVRNNLHVLLNDENCETHLMGYYMGRGRQLIDNHTFVDHAMPNCFSNELYKGILDDKAQGVFNGRILVRQDAQKTNALQSNKSLLLTDDAVVNAKPQLEIFADDVKCTHGATIGQLDEEALFYLRARGISEEMAGAMLRHAFVADVLQSVKDEDVRERLDAKIIERFTLAKKTNTNCE